MQGGRWLFSAEIVLGITLTGYFFLVWFWFGFLIIPAVWSCLVVVGSWGFVCF